MMYEMESVVKIQRWWRTVVAIIHKCSYCNESTYNDGYVCSDCDDKCKWCFVGEREYGELCGRCDYKNYKLIKEGY